MEAGIRFRKAGPEDIEQLAVIRKIQLQDEGQEANSLMDEELLRFFREKMAGGELIEWVAEGADGRMIATAAILFIDFPPAFTNPGGKKGYITNMYTADAYRGRGIAGQLMEKLEQEAAARSITKLILFASEMGRKAYIKSGFEETNVLMEKDIAVGAGL